MSVLAKVLQLVLRVLLHSFHLISLLAASWHRLFSTPPLPLQVTRRRIPRHLAVLLVLDSPHEPALIHESLLEIASRTVGWCRSVGIEKLTLYDSEGVLMDCVDQISQRASAADEPNGYDSSSGSDIEYPLTPPLSDCSDSRPLSPEDRFQKNTSVITVCLPEVIRKKTSRYGLKKRHSEREKSDASKPPLTLCIASRQSSKPAIAVAATSLARSRARAPEQPELTVQALGTVIEGEYKSPSRYFMIVHHLRPSDGLPLPLELHGFPPWQIRLTEIYHCCKQRPTLEWLNLRSQKPGNAPELLTEIDFRAALDEYARAEMRFGK
ncbi:hypothetical protein B0H14DRAFT_2331589 [Mycena olivaceomarginata]|nr:hypothetical protein B0H14DRAFT_2331589 [Mycena olivaceomarginata]